MARDALSWMLEDAAADEPVDPLTIPAIKHHVAHDFHDDEMGLRLLLERPDALEHAWLRAAGKRRRRGPRRGFARPDGRFGRAA